LALNSGSPPHSCYSETSHQIREAGELRLAEVQVQDGESLESALRRFKRKVQTEDIITETKRHSFYLKPGEKQRTKEALARKRNRKKRTRDIE
jgi:small subunit ribosomal protein S21